MKSPRLFASIAMLAASIICLGVAGGCKNNNANGATALRGPALDVPGASPAAATPAPQAYTPAPAPVAQPVVYDSAPAAVAPTAPSTPVSASTSGGSYTVRKGDTLYSIAKSHYGSGKEFTRIVSANPGLTPEKLRVGQTIALP